MNVLRRPAAIQAGGPVDAGRVRAQPVARAAVASKPAAKATKTAKPSTKAIEKHDRLNVRVVSVLVAITLYCFAFPSPMAHKALSLEATENLYFRNAAPFSAEILRVDEQGQEVSLCVLAAHRTRARSRSPQHMVHSSCV